MTALSSAETLAVRQAAAGNAQPGRECLSFRLGTVEYGIDILKVQEIRGYEPATRIANAPAAILGMLDLRGVIAPILNLRLKFGQAQAQYDATTATIVLNVADRVVGVVVDAVCDVLDLQPEQIRPAPEFHAAVNTSFITGIASLEQNGAPRMLVLLDIERLMGSVEMGLVRQAPAAAAT